MDGKIVSNLLLPRVKYLKNQFIFLQNFSICMKLHEIIMIKMGFYKLK